MLRRGTGAVLRAVDILLHPIRRARARRLLSRLDKPGAVQFICQGNICRSPFAEYAFRARVPGEGIAASSAGFVGPGRPSPPEGVRTAARRGIDLTPHRSQLVNTGTLRKTPLLIVMDAPQRRLVAALAGRPRRDVIILGDLDPHDITRRAIRDPWGRPEGVFDEVYARIDRCVAELARLLRR